MASNITVKRFSFSILILTILFSACTRVSSSELGLGLLPSMDAINTKDTIIDVEAETVDMLDSVKVYGNDDHILGEITNDPIFGKTKATMFFQLVPQYFPFYIPGTRDSIIVDSAVLVLKYNGFYGDSSVPVKINVNQVDPTTPLDIKQYYSANYPDAYGIKAGSALGNPVTVDLARVGDSVINRYEKAKDQIRFRLYDRIANQFIKVFDSNTAYHNDTTLRAYFPGFALSIDPTANKNVLLKINLADTNTKLALYYKSNYTPLGATGVKDTTVAYLKFSLISNGDANFIKRDRTGSELAKHLGKGKDSLVYIQTSPGTSVKIKIPGLRTFANKLIHRAELITEQVPDDARITGLETQMLPPKYLFLGAYDSTNKVFRTVPNDYQTAANTELFARFGGYLTYKALNGYDKVASYNFNITRYVQGVISRTDSLFDLRMYAPVNDSVIYVPPYPYNKTSSTEYLGTSLGNQPAYGRVRLGGGSHSKFKMRLRIYYSDL